MRLLRSSGMRDTQSTNSVHRLSRNAARTSSARVSGRPSISACGEFRPSDVRLATVSAYADSAYPAGVCAELPKAHRFRATTTNPLPGQHRPSEKVESTGHLLPGCKSRCCCIAHRCRPTFPRSDALRNKPSESGSVRDANSTLSSSTHSRKVKVPRPIPRTPHFRF